VRRLLALGTAAAAALGLARLLAARRRGASPVREVPADPRAGELRRWLDESRVVVDEREEFESRETPVDEAEPAPGDPDKRRRRVHHDARAVVEQMRDATQRPE
jgi:hypothetical protein